jgi:hypothetical protein
MKKRVYWKLLRAADHGHESPFAPRASICKYRVGEWTNAQGDCGPLTCFDTLENLYTFYKGFEFYFYYGTYMSGMFAECIIGRRSEAKKIWGGGFVTNGTELPKGTVLSRNIKLISKPKEVPQL